MDLALEHIELAARTINPVFRNSPQFVDDQLCTALERTVLVKCETVNPLHSFKGRGADFLVRQLANGAVPVCASAGNFGQAMAYAGRAVGTPVEVFVDSDVDPAKAERMRVLGATVTVAHGPSGTASRAARERAGALPTHVFVEDGKEPAVAEGAGTIGIELLAGDPFDTLVVPVGDGALINGVARWIKAHAPEIRVVGVCAEGAPAMERAWRAGTIPSTDSAGTDSAGTDSAGAGTIARTLVPVAPAVESVQRMRALVDDIVLVDDDSLRAAMRIAADVLGVLLEPAGAAGLAAIASHDPRGERLATILTGANPRAELLESILG